jgi:hypothetical protein
MSDIAAELTNSLDRTGRGGMLAPFRIYDGTVTQPGLAFANEAGLGLWRSTTGTMHMASLGANVMTFEPGQSTSPVKFIQYGTSQYRTTGQHWWQVKVDTDDTLTFNPSASVNAEDFAAAKYIKFGPTGSLSAAGAVNFGSLTLGTYPVSYTPVSGELRGDRASLVNWLALGMGHSPSAPGWVYNQSSFFGYTLQASTTGFSEYLTNAVSPGANSIAAGLTQVSAGTTTGFTRFVPVGIMGAPRRPGSEIFNLDVHGTGVVTSSLASDSGGTAIKMTVGGAANYIDCMQMLGSGAPWVVGGNSSLVFRLTKGSTLIEQVLRLDPSGLVTVGDNSLASPGAITSTYKVMGTYTGTLAFANYQMAIVNPGSNITGLTMSFGQVARILVAGGGAITLPAFIQLAVGSANNWGATASIVSLVYSNATVFGTITPF